MAACLLQPGAHILDRCLGLDLVGREKSLKSERRAAEAAALKDAENKTTLGKNIRAASQKLTLAAKHAKIQKRR